GRHERPPAAAQSPARSPAAEVGDGSVLRDATHVRARSAEPQVRTLLLEAAAQHSALVRALRSIHLEPTLVIRGGGSDLREQIAAARPPPERHERELGDRRRSPPGLVDHASADSAAGRSPAPRGGRTRYESSQPTMPANTTIPIHRCAV